MEITPQILFGSVMHKRLFPKENGFTYGIYYLHLPLSRLGDIASNWRFGINRRALTSFHEKDHGARDGKPLQQWAQDILARYGVENCRDISLLAMPRVFGQVFNPVSFWFCKDAQGQLRAVICEVNNTFGETHSYICRPENGSVISGDTWIEAEKVFHVSPFLPREGSYKFRFNPQGDKIGIWIDYYAADSRKQLLTALSGTFVPLDAYVLRRAFWRYPLVALVALWRIHWHAVRLLAKGVRYVPKPPQKPEKTSISAKLTKM